jgi:beta-lactamase regulating signal transducer with metallopeptidase domain
LRPYICFPQATLARLTDEEKAAVIQHELAHIRHGDLPVTFVIRSLGDILWFIPGYHFLSRRIDNLRERMADRAAVLAGASAPHLASALLKLCEMPSEPSHELYSAFFRERGILKARIAVLLNFDAKKPRAGTAIFHAAVGAWTAVAVMVVTVGGNHVATELEGDSLFSLSPRVEQVMKHLGFR